MNEVLIAVGMTAGVVFALTLFAMQTKIDFTAWGGKILFSQPLPSCEFERSFSGALLCVLVVFVLAGFIAAFFPQVKILT